MLRNNFSVENNSTRKNFIATSSFQKSKDEIMGTWTSLVPYTKDNWHWWAPRALYLDIRAGVFDNKKVFSGRTANIKQEGSKINCELQDNGWKLKQSYTGGDYDGDIVEILPKMIEAAGLIPILRGVRSEKIDRKTVWGATETSGSTTGDTICVTGKPSCGYACGDYVDTKKCWKNYCPLCKKSGTLSDNPKGVYEHEITCDTSKGGCDTDYCAVCGRDKNGGGSRAQLTPANG